MIEKVLLDYLGAELSVPVVMEKPESPPVSFVLVEKTGSSETNKIYRSTLAIQSYAATLYDAACLNDQVKTTMENLIGEKEIIRCDLNSDYNYTDTRTKQYRYQAVYNITHY